MEKSYGREYKDQLLDNIHQLVLSGLRLIAHYIEESVCHSKMLQVFQCVRFVTTEQSVCAARCFRFFNLFITSKQSSSKTTGESHTSSTNRLANISVQASAFSCKILHIAEAAMNVYVREIGKLRYNSSENYVAWEQPASAVLPLEVDASRRHCDGHRYLQVTPSSPDVAAWWCWQHDAALLHPHGCCGWHACHLRSSTPLPHGLRHQ